MLYGSGKYTYELVEGWLKLPEGPAGESFRDIGCMDVDSQDRVYIFNRGEQPVMVFDRDGNGIVCRAQDEYLADAATIDGSQVVSRATCAGQLVITLHDGYGVGCDCEGARVEFDATHHDGGVAGIGALKPCIA